MNSGNNIIDLTQSTSSDSSDDSSDNNGSDSSDDSLPLARQVGGPLPFSSSSDDDDSGDDSNTQNAASGGPAPAAPSAPPQTVSPASANRLDSIYRSGASPLTLGLNPNHAYTGRLTGGTPSPSLDLLLQANSGGISGGAAQGRFSPADVQSFLQDTGQAGPGIGAAAGGAATRPGRSLRPYQKIKDASVMQTTMMGAAGGSRSGNSGDKLGNEDDMDEDDEDDQDDIDKDDMDEDDEDEDKSGPAAGGKVGRKRKLVVNNLAGAFNFARLPYPILYSDEKIHEKTIGSYREVLLRTNSPEYNSVKANFAIGGQTTAIVLKIYRIEDPLKLAMFQLELASMKEKQNPVEVKSLYHSTRNSNDYHKILKENFSMKYASRSLLGSGIYFAQVSAYSQDSQYSQSVKPDFFVDYARFDDDVERIRRSELNQTRIMLVCDVILGRVLMLRQKVPTHEDMCAPVENFDSHGYSESQFNNTNIYCVFSNKRILPKYVIYYSTDPAASAEDNTGIQSQENFERTQRHFPLQDRVPDPESLRNYGNDREVVVELENTPKTQTYSYERQRKFDEYDLVVTKFQK